MKRIELRNGVQIPDIGLGTWKIPTQRGELAELIQNACECGYRLFDTAAAYLNEMALGKALRELQFPRDELFIQNKLWITCYGYEQAQEACKKSLRKMKLDHFDCYLMHWPVNSRQNENWKEINAETWRGLERLYEDGYVRAIGVCNFKVNHLQELLKTAQVVPYVNQTECHPGMFPKDTIAYCRERGIQVQASSPLGNGEILKEQILVDIAEKKSVQTAKICLKWGLKHNLIILPKTVKKERLRDNIELDDVELSEEEMERIDNMPFCGGLGIDSDEVTSFEGL